MTGILTNLPAAGTTTPAGGETPRVWTITLPAGMTLLNANRKVHHMKRMELVRALRTAGKAAAQNAKVPAIGRAHVFGYYHPATRARRDPANWYPSFKAAIDGIVDAGVLPDDDDKHLIGPDMRLGTVVKGGQISLLVIELQPLEGAVTA